MRADNQRSYFLYANPRDGGHEDGTTGTATFSSRVKVMLLGLGSGWVACDCLFLEMPLFIRRQPEGLALASKMVLAGQIAVPVSVFLFIFLKTRYGGFGRSDQDEQADIAGRDAVGEQEEANGLRIRRMFNHQKAEKSVNEVRNAFLHRTVGLVVVAQLGTLIFATLLWHTTVSSSISIALYAASFAANACGMLMTLAVAPWIANNLHATLVPALFFGNTLGTGIASSVTLVQRPGSQRNRAFGATFYFALFSGLMIFPVVAYRLLVTNIKASKNAAKSSSSMSSNDKDDENDKENNNNREAVSIVTNIAHEGKSASAFVSAMEKRTKRSSRYAPRISHGSANSTHENTPIIDGDDIVVSPLCYQHLSEGDGIGGGQDTQGNFAAARSRDAEGAVEPINMLEAALEGQNQAQLRDGGCQEDVEELETHGMQHEERDINPCDRPAGGGVGERNQREGWLRTDAGVVSERESHLCCWDELARESRLFWVTLRRFWPATRPYAIMFAFVTVVAWNIFRSIIPYASARAEKDRYDINDDEGSSGGSSPGGERTLQWALTASFFGNLAGTGCSNVCAAKIQRIEGLTKLIVTFGLNFLALATATVISFHPVLVVCLAVTLRFLDGYMSPLIFQAIAQQHDDVEERDAIVTIVAVVQSSVNFIAAWITFSLVETGTISDSR